MPRHIEIAINCDICGKATDDQPDFISLARRAVEVDLCEDHRLELRTFIEPFLNKGRKPKDGTPPKAGTSRKRPAPHTRVTCTKGCGFVAANGTGLASHERACDGTPREAPHGPACDFPGCTYVAGSERGLTNHKSGKHVRYAESIAS